MVNDMPIIGLIFLCIMFVCPISALFCNRFFISNPIAAGRVAGYFIGLGCLTGVGFLVSLSVSQHPTVYLFLSIHTLSLLLCVLVLLVSFIVHRFSLRYMHGDRLYKRYFLLLSLFTLTAMLMVLADNVFLFWGAWTVSNVLLVLLMVHKKEWVAAKNAGLLAFYTLICGSLCLLVAFFILSITYSTSSISSLTQLSSTEHLSLLYFSMGLILIGGLAQSGLFPFHRWLISSLNSPTPVSAIMHAGLVNGGGILIVNFAPLMLRCPHLLLLLFIIGSVSAILGTIWKLMQHDIKKMLACSTMAQMGFMMMQCGLGLFAAAIAHLCWHGLFKAYLFLSSGSAVKQKKSEAHSSKISSIMLIASLLGGLVAMFSFAFMTHKSVSIHQASSFVLFFAYMAGAQLMLAWVRVHQKVLSLVTGILLSLLSGLLYGASIQLIYWFIPNIAKLNAPELSVIHWTIMALFGSLWVAFNWGVHHKIGESKLGCWFYMHLFNASQPSRKTVTTLRKDYNY